MSYIRVIPRDLFNEANLLKCIGKLVIHAEKYGNSIDIEHDGEAFHVEQSELDGSIYIDNIQVTINGYAVHFSTPLNSRDSWPLYALPDGADSEIKVFNDDGTLSAEMIAFIEG